MLRGCLYGFDINYTYYERDLLNPEQDLRSLSAENFANNQYIETRTRMDSIQSLTQGNKMKNTV